MLFENSGNQDGFGAGFEVSEPKKQNSGVDLPCR